MMTGLIASALLTMLVVPALYKILFRDPPSADDINELDAKRASDCIPRAPIIAALILITGIGISVPATAYAQRPPSSPPDAVTLAEAILLANQRLALQAAASRITGAQHMTTSAWRQAWLPSTHFSLTLAQRSDDLGIVAGPIAITQTPIRDAQFSGIVRQPLLDWSQQHDALTAMRTHERRAELEHTHLRRDIQLEVIDAYLRLLDIDAGLLATDAFVTSLASQLQKTRALVNDGRALESDQLRIQVALAEARQDLLTLTNQRIAAEYMLGRATGQEGRVNASQSIDELSPPDAPPSNVASLRAHRYDLMALATHAEAVDADARAVFNDLLPTLHLEGRVIYNSALSIKPEKEGNIRLA